MAITMAVRELTDPELIGAARKGDADAYGELYRRHSPSALAAARALTRSRSDADDVASEAFARVLRALQSGGGPDVSFRPYLVTAVRNVFYDKVRRNREEPSADMSDEVNVALLDASNSQEDGAFAAAAFATLPERWQLVLWHTEVEGRSVSEVAPLLGLAPNAVAALAYRAREGLRQAYLQAHLRDQQAAECRDCANNLGAYVRDGLSARDRRRVDAHLDGCASCTSLVAELADTNNTLRAALIPALIGVSSAAYLGGLGGGSGALAWFTRLPKRQQAAAGGGAAAGVLALALLISSLGGGSPSTAPAPTNTAAPVPAPATSVAPPPTVPPATPPPTQPTVPPVSTVPPPSTAPAPSTVAPTTAVPRTTVPGTTLPPAPPSISASAVQRTVALANGQVRIEVTVTNTGAAPANGVRIDVPAPPGATFAFAEHFRLPAVTFVSALAPGWSCTGNVSCTIPTLAAGASTVALLTFDISPSAPANLTLTPAVVEPVGAIVTITPVTLTVNAIDGLLAAETARGTVRAIGNSVTTCDDMSPNCVDARNGSGPAVDHNAHAMQYVNTAGGTFNSSSAQLALSGTVARAFLVWGGDVQQGGAAPAPGSRNTVLFSTPGGRSTVVADAVTDNPGDTYFAVAEVTSLVTGSGTYSVADVQTALGTASFGGWSLVLIEHDPAMPERLLLVAAPLAVVSTSTPLAFDLELLVPQNGGATVAGVCFEGDRGLSGDSMVLSGQSLVNLGRGAAPGPRDPAFDNTLGTDVFSHRFDGLTGDQLVLQVSTTDDRVMVGAVALAIDL